MVVDIAARHHQDQEWEWDWEWEVEDMGRVRTVWTVTVIHPLVVLPLVPTMALPMQQLGGTVEGAANTRMSVDNFLLSQPVNILLILRAH
jgi:hypothetical protein